MDARTEAYCFRSAEACQSSRGVPCGLADGDECRESSARTCAQAGAGFVWYCPVTASLDDPTSGQTCYRRQSECERTSGNDCGTSDVNRCTTAGAACSGVQGSGFVWRCPSAAQTGQQQQAGGATNTGGTTNSGSASNMGGVSGSPSG